MESSKVDGMSSGEAALRDALVDVLSGAGVEVVTDAQEAQRVLDEANGEARLQAMIGGLQKASDFIVSFLKGKTKQRSSKLEIPERVNHLAERSIGHKIITMWTEKSLPLMLRLLKEPRIARPATIVISEADAAKIRQDAEDALRNDEKLRQQKVYHGSGADFEAFDHSHMGEGEGAQ